MKSIQRILFFFLYLALLVAIPAGAVQAHAELVRSVPAAGQALERFPTQAELEFSEEVDPLTVRARLLDTSSRVVAEGTPSVDPGNLLVKISLPAQPDGIYTLAWQVASADDGHITNGILAFSVGAQTPRASMLPPPGTPDPSAQLPTAAEVALRWLGYLSIALALGSALFAVLVWRPAYRAVEGDFAAWDTWLAALLRRWVWMGAIGAGVSILGVLLLEAVQLSSGPAGVSIWAGLAAGVGHHAGGWFWVQVLMLALMGGFASLLPKPGGGEIRRWWESAAYGLVLLVTFSLSGHNAALGLALPVAADWLHLVSMSAWVGGLAALGALLWRERRLSDEAAAPLLAQAGRRFSKLALTCVIVLAGTGIYAGLLQVRTLPALTGTRYGQAILLKEGLFALLILLGAINQRGILPRLARSGLSALRGLGRSVRVEIGLAALLLVVVGGLMSLSPAYQALQADRRQGLHEVYQQGGVRIDFRVAPVQVGDNELAVDVRDDRPGAEQAPATVLLHLLYPFGDTGMTEIEAAPAGPGRYTARGSYLSLAGLWEVEVVLSRPGFEDVRPEFRIDLSQR